MRIFLWTLAAAGALVAVLGGLLSVGVLILVGLAMVAMALVMGALAAPATRRGR